MANPLRDQPRMLDEIGCRVDHPGYQYLVVGDFCTAQIFPLVRMPRIGRLERQPGRTRPHAHVKNLCERNVVSVRPFVVPPTEMHAHRFGRNIGGRMVERCNIALGNPQKFLVGEVLILVVAGRAEIRCIDLQDKARLDDRLVFFLEGICQRLDIGVFIPVIAVRDEFGQHPG
jgi:hypothetical protein